MLNTLHPAVAAWFRETLGEPTAPQQQGWPLIRDGHHTLIAAPTGTGKTLAAFLWALDRLLQQGTALTDRTEVLYVSPLKALGNDVQKNLLAPLAAIRERDPTLPEVRVLVRTGDTPAHERQAMLKKPPHVLVTTPESLYLLLTSVRGRAMLAGIRTVIVDEIHAVADDKRGAHLALSLERLDHLVRQDGGNLQRIGLSATQRPISLVAELLAGVGRECKVVDVGHRRAMDLAIEAPGAGLGTICAQEHWLEIYGRMVELIQAHRTTLVFVNTRKMAERVAAQLAERLGKELVTSHHGSLARERRLQAEQRLKSGSLKALVATASLELGIDIGDVDLVLQVGPTPAIATWLQRIGRAGHGPGRVPKARMFPLTRDDLAACAALQYGVQRGDLDALELAPAPLDILAQQIVAACAAEPFREDELFDLCRGAAHYKNLERAQFDAVLALHDHGRAALLHRDGVNGRVRGTRSARLVSITGGGAIPDLADYDVILDPEDVKVGTVHEDFAVEASVGDVFQLGNASWQVMRIGSGQLRVHDAKGVPPSLPFWVGEAPARTRELSGLLSDVRERGTDLDFLQRDCLLPPGAAAQLAEYHAAGQQALGAMPTVRRIVLERFFDETGGQQLVIHAPFGSRINRALGLALRKRLCTGFGFELQAAANEEAILISLGPMHSFALDEVFGWLRPQTATELLVQAALQMPFFQTRWRWNVTRSLVIPRHRGGRRVPAPLLRMRAGDELAKAFPQVQACPETLPGGPIEVPMEHPLVRETMLNCLHEVMDLDGLLAVLEGVADGSIEVRCVETAQPSVLSEGVMHAMPYAFLDDAPLEERRTQAVIRARLGAPPGPQDGGELDPAAVALVKEQCWPEPRDAEELHETLRWIGWLADAECESWRAWLGELAAAGRAVQENGRWYAAESSRDAVELWRGRLEAIGPVARDVLTDEDQVAIGQLEAEGVAMPARLHGKPVLCHRRLLARIRTAMLERLRAEIRPVSQSDYDAFLLRWQRRVPELRRHGPRGLADVLEQMAGQQFAVVDWEDEVLGQRVQEYKREWLDQLTLAGEFAWLSLRGGFRGPCSRAPVALVPRKDLAAWLRIWREPFRTEGELSSAAAPILELLKMRGALFPTDLQAAAGLLPSWLESGLSELVGLGLATCDSFAVLRQLAVAPSKRKFPVYAVGRWSAIARPGPVADARAVTLDEDAQHFARALLARYGVVSLAAREREEWPLPWRVVLRALRGMELRSEVRGGRFVAGWAGEQFALPEAVTELRRVRQAAGT